MANRRTKKKSMEKKKVVQEKKEVPQSYHHDENETSEDSLLFPPLSTQDTQWCPDAALREGVDKFFAALQSATGKVCQFIPSELEAGEDPLRREFRNLAAIKDYAEKVMCECSITNVEGMATLKAKLEHQANLGGIASRKSEELKNLRISNSGHSTDKQTRQHALDLASIRFDFMDLDTDDDTSSDREDGDPESKYSELIGNSLLAKQVLKESSIIEAEMHSLKRRIAMKERKLQTITEELRKTQEELKTTTNDHPIKQYLPVVKSLLNFEEF